MWNIAGGIGREVKEEGLQRRRSEAGQSHRVASVIKATHQGIGIEMRKVGSTL